MATVATSKDRETLMDLVFEVRRRCDALEEELREGTALTPAELVTLRGMPDSGEIRTGDLARQAGLSPSRGGRVIDALVRAGVLRRETDPHDRRASVLSLTPDGREVLRRTRELAARCERELQERLTDGESRRVLEGLRILLAGMARHGREGA